MSKSTTWLVLAVIFLAGAVSGSLLTVGLAPSLLHHRPPGAEQIKRFWLVHLNQRLGLTPDQQAKIEPILTEAGNQLQAIHRDEAGRASQIIEQTNQRIAGVLTPEQKAKLDAMEKEIDQDRERMFPGHRGPHGGGMGMPGMPMHHPPGADDRPMPPPPPPLPDMGTNAPSGHPAEP